MDQRPPPLDPQSHTWLELGEVQRLLLDSYPGLVLSLDLDGRIRWINSAGAERLGYGREELTGRELAGSLLAPEEVALRAAQLTNELGERVESDVGVFSTRLRRGSPDEHGWVLRHRDGSPNPTRLAMGSVRNHQGEMVGLIAVEPPARAGDDARLHFTHHDSLTGLPTRAVLADRAEMAIQRSARQHSVVALMLVEIVGFESMCEELGHTVGDDILRAAASRLHFELRKTDTAVRLDRGQFAAMLVDLHHADEAKLVAKKIQQALSTRVNVGVAFIPLKARVGVAWFPSHGDQLLPLLQAAESALDQVEGDDGGVAFAAVPST